MTQTVYVSGATYAELKRFISLVETEENRSLSFDGWIFELLKKHVSACSLKLHKEISADYPELERSPDLVPLFLRPQTYWGLKSFGKIFHNFDPATNNLDSALFKLIESEMNSITINRLRREIADREEKVKQITKALEVLQ